MYRLIMLEPYRLISFFDKDKVSYPEYLEYSKNYNNDWSLKKECIKYCEQDCISLHQVIQKFTREIWKKERVDVIAYPSLSSLAFAIFRTYYFNDSKIPLIVGEAYKFLQTSYTGGAVDVYKPRRVKGKKKFTDMMWIIYFLMLWLQWTCLLEILLILKVTLKK